MSDLALPMDGLVSRPSGCGAQARRLRRAGLAIVLGAIFPIAAWMTLAPLSMAVVAPGFVKVDLNRRPVQHLEGGIVRAVLVRDGQKVKAGEPILMLGDVGVEADRNRVEYRVHIERAAMARFEAEHTLASRLVFPDDLRRAAASDSRVQQALSKETALFNARRDALSSEISLMRAQRKRIESELEAMQQQIVHEERSLALQRTVLEANRDLLKSGYISSTRLQQLEAGAADYAAKLEERQSEMARTLQRQLDVDLRIQTAQNQYAQAASDQRKVTAARLAEIEQEQRKSIDAANRQVVVAPANGEIIDLKVTSPGAVVRPGDTIAEVVPFDANLMIEARIRPEEVSNVFAGQPARIKFTAFKYRNSSIVTGKVTYVSGDRLVDRGTNQPYYTVIVGADSESLAAVSELKLQAGMPAEVYIEGTTQTALQYLLEPITSTLRKAGRQM